MYSHEPKVLIDWRRGCIATVKHCWPPNADQPAILAHGHTFVPGKSSLLSFGCTYSARVTNEEPWGHTQRFIIVFQWWLNVKLRILNSWSIPQYCWHLGLALLIRSSSRCASRLSWWLLFFLVLIKEEPGGNAAYRHLSMSNTNSSPPSSAEDPNADDTDHLNRFQVSISVVGFKQFIKTSTKCLSGGFRRLFWVLFSRLTWYSGYG